MPPAAAAMPRKMLPPPTTMAMSTSRLRTTLMEPARRLVVAGSMALVSPPSACPLSLRRTRWKAELGDRPPRPSGLGACLAELEAGEAPHFHVLADDAHQVGAQLLDGAVGVLDERLLHQARLGEELLELAGDDLLEHVLGLALDLLGVDGLLADDDVFRHLVARDPARRGRGDVHGEVVGELLEGIAARHEVGLHADLHEHADLAAGVDVRIHTAVFGRCLLYTSDA